MYFNSRVGGVIIQGTCFRVIFFLNKKINFEGAFINLNFDQLSLLIMLVTIPTKTAS